MTIVVDPDVKNGNNEELDKELDELGVEESTFQVPDKLKGKTAEEIAEIYTNLEKELGRKNQEVGELRKTADSYIRQHLETANKPPAQEEKRVEFDDLIDDPQSAISGAVKPQLEEVRSELQSLKAERKFESFQSKHPDYLEIGGSQEFVDWVSADPQRSNIYSLAQQYDYDAADMLLTWYKDAQKSVLETAKNRQEQERQKALRKATSETGVATNSGSEKVFSRSELIDMRNNNPSKFNAMQDEIILAYREGRVK